MASNTLVALNGSGNIARSVLQRILANNAQWSTLRLIDARPYRQSVYRWQDNLGQVQVEKQLARSAAQIELGLEGANQAVYFTHDYFSMSSDKNQHLIAAAKLTRKHGVNRVVAVCPPELDLAWSEENKTYLEKVKEAEDEALQANPNLTILKPCLAFGPETHFIHYLSQCAIIGKCPHDNLLSAKNQFTYSPIHTDDIATAVGQAIQSPRPGRYSLGGPESMNLRAILNTLEVSANRNEGATRGPLTGFISDICNELLWDFFVGTTPDQNMSRMIKFHEQNLHLQGEFYQEWNLDSYVKFSEYYRQNKLNEDNYSHPTTMAYRCAHTD